MRRSLLWLGVESLEKEQGVDPGLPMLPVIVLLGCCPRMTDSPLRALDACFPDVQTQPARLWVAVMHTWQCPTSLKRVGNRRQDDACTRSQHMYTIDFTMGDQ